MAHRLDPAGSTDTLAQIQAVVMGMVGRRLMYRDLVAPNGRSARAG